MHVTACHVRLVSLLNLEAQYDNNRSSAQER